LKDSTNPELRKKVLLGQWKPYDLVRASSEVILFYFLFFSKKSKIKNILNLTKNEIGFIK